MSRELKFRAWNDETRKFETNMPSPFDCSGSGVIFPYYFNLDYEQYTGLKDKNGDREIYEYDIIDGEGNIIGNYHETPELLKDKTNLLIQGFGTKTWLTTYQEAVERGCHDA